MDLSFGPEYEAYRETVRSFVARYAAEAPRTMQAGRIGPENLAWQKRLIENGYVARTIPREYGGAGEASDILKTRIIDEEFAAARMPGGLFNVGAAFLVPMLLELGTEAQKQRWIRPTIHGESLWCEGFSEPDAGSDLASLKTHAVEDGDDFVVNGQKIWTSDAHNADMMFCLVRTETGAPKHQSLSMLYFSMKTPGIEVRPLATMTGQSEFNEVFFTDVRVPKGQIIGARGQGWEAANATLKHERDSVGNPNSGGANAAMRLNQIAAILAQEVVDGRPQIDNALLRDRLVQLRSRAEALRCHGLRMLTASARRERKGAAGLIVKLVGCELNHQIAALAIDAMGEDGTLADLSWQRRYMYALGLIIGGGTAQIQKNIISERGLGMPREPKAKGA